MQVKQERSFTWLDTPILSNITLNWETLIFAAIVILAIVTRFYDLESRVMSHDENSHVYYAWQLSQGAGYSHTPMTHGPYQFHIVALSYFLFGDNDFTARIPAALFGIAMIAFLWYYRRYLGRVGTLVAAGLMLISPFLLYYARYVRNDIFSALFGVVMVWAILRYIETGEARYTYWLTAVTVLHFTTKETSFIYTAQALLFLGFLFVQQITQKRWERPDLKNAFLVLLVLAFILMAVGFGLNIYFPSPVPIEPNAELESTPITTAPLYFIIPVGVGLLAVLGALFVVIIGMSWDRLRQNRVFSLILLQLTLVLPQLAPFPVSTIGWDPLDYTTMGMLRTGIFIGILAAIAIAAGLLWNSRLWLINAAIFYIPFTIFYTTVFTNGAGFFTGMVGSLGYWLVQQGVERGSQPWYYYILVQIPVYEFLPFLGSILAGYYWIRLKGKPAPEGDDQAELQLDPPLEEGVQPQTYTLIIPLLAFWSITSIIAYTVAGEKMPWLTVHIAWPMILLASWGLGKLIERIDWVAVRSKRGLLLVTLIVVFLVSLSSAIGMIAGPNPPFQGKELHQLNTTNAFVLAVVMAIICAFSVSKVIPGWELEQIVRLTTLTIFTFLALITARAAFRAAYINYDYPTEYLVYAHSGAGPKIALKQIEELSLRTTDGLDMVVAYDDETTYPYWWYLRNYPNQKYYGPNPTRELRDAPVILVGDNNFDKIAPVVGQAYHQFDYIRIWWPNQDYYNLNWERIKNALFNPQMRAAIFQIWFNRDYSQYAQLKGSDLSLPNWSPSDRMRLYVRKDIAAQVWNFGAMPVDVEEILADPYEGKEVTLLADNVLGTNGTDPGKFEMPRAIAVAPDGSLYIADTGNHRIQHLSADGDVLNIWGYFADRSQSDAPGGSFYEPWGIAVGPDGNVFVADTWNHRIQKFTPQGEFITQWGYFGQAETGLAFWGPRDVLVDEQGRVFITDTGNKRVVVFTSDGEFLTTFGSAGLLEGQFDEPVGLAVDTDGRIYVADTWNKRVQVFEPDASGLSYSPVLEWEIVGWYGQSLDNKPFIAVDRQGAGRVFVSDPESYRILEFNAQGEFLRYWGDYGNGPESFNLPGGLAVGPDGELWVADAGNHRILHFSLPEEYPNLEE